LEDQWVAVPELKATEVFEKLLFQRKWERRILSLFCTFLQSVDGFEAVLLMKVFSVLAPISPPRFRVRTVDASAEITGAGMHRDIF